MNPILILGGAIGMNPRYYIKGGRVYYRYNNLFKRKQRAIRRDEVEASIKLRQNIILALILAIVIVTVCEVAYIFISSSLSHKPVERTYSNISVTVEEIPKEPVQEVSQINYDEIISELQQIDLVNEIAQEVKALEVDEYVEEPIEIEETIIEEVEEEPISQVITNEYEAIDLVYREVTKQTLDMDGQQLVEVSLPSEYYGDINFSDFYPFEDYNDITNTRSGAYKITRSDNCYTDEHGLRRYRLAEGEFSIGEDDFVVAMGTFYKPRGTIGNRFLVETTTGCFTIRTGDEKSDLHTDQMNMFTTHGGGKYAAIIEFIVDENNLDSDIKSSGTITKGATIEESIKGEILHIYEIL